MYTKIINETTKECLVGTGTNKEFYKSINMNEKEVEQAWNGSWYIKGYAPKAPEKTYIEKRLSEYPPISEQLDMIYWDKVKGTNIWTDKIREIKQKYPKS